MPRRIIVIIAALIAVFVSNCSENETSFIVEHAKAPPEAPACQAAVTDGFIAQGTLDLAFRNPYGGWYLVSNNLKRRKDMGNLTAESNGIIIDGSEVFVRDLNGNSLGSTEYYEFEGFIPPEEHHIAFALSIPQNIATLLAQNYGCPTAQQLSDNMAESAYDIGNQTVYSIVRFIGHTNGNVDVETPEFTLPISLCCGCLIDWMNCLLPCDRYCVEPEEHGMCTVGVYNGGDLVDCRSLSYDPYEGPIDCATCEGN